MRKTTVAAIQMGCGSDVKENIEKASELIREAAAQGAQVILPPELFERPYFCQERRYEYYGYARTPEEDDAVIHMKKLAKELETVIPVSFYEAGDHRQMFNSVAVIDADGSVCGIYRKTHIPDDHYYQEKFYFTPGDTGFRAFKTRYGTIGVSGDGKRLGTKRGGTPFLSNCNRKRADTWLRQYAALETVHDGACGM